jgi:MFS family permease
VVAYFVVLGVANGVWLARIPAIKQHLQLSDGVLGLALLAAPAGLVVVVPIASRVVHRAGSRRPAQIAGIIGALTPIALGFAPDLAGLMVGLFVFGFAGGLLDVSMNSQAVQVERGYGRPLMTSFHACYSFGALIGALLGGIFAWAGVGPAMNFVAVCLPLSVLALLAAGWLVAEQPGGTEQPEATEQSSATAQAAEEAPGSTSPRWTLALFMLGLLALCSLLGEGAADGWSAVYMHDSLRTSAGLAALGYAGFAVAMAVGRLAGDRLAARFGAAALLRCSGLLAAIGLAAALLSGSPIGAIAGFVVFGIGLSSTFPLLLSAAGNAEPQRPSYGIARVAGLGYVGMLGGPVLIGGLASAVGLPLALGLPVLLALFLAAGGGLVRTAARQADQAR